MSDASVGNAALAETARARFVSWLRWYMVTYPDEAPSIEALARRIGISRSALSQLLKPANKRAPDFATLIGASRALGLPIDMLLLHDPPRFGHREN